MGYIILEIKLWGSLPLKCISYGNVRSMHTVDKHRQNLHGLKGKGKDNVLIEIASNVLIELPKDY